MSQLDVLFINPSNQIQVYQYLATTNVVAVEPPTWMLLMTNYARNNGLSVYAIDMQNKNHNPDYVLNIIKYENPKLIVVCVMGQQPSASTQQMPAARTICNKIKEECPETNIMITGTHISALPERTLDEELVDFACYADGFQSTVELAQALKNNEKDFSNVHGICYNVNGKYKYTSRGNNLTGEDFNNKVIEPAWDLIDMSIYRSSDWHSLEDIDNRLPYASIYTSFNCSFACDFCCISSPFGKPGYVKFDPILIVNQLDKLVNEYGVHNVKIVDEMHLLDAKHVLSICDEINKRKLGDSLNMWFYGRVDVTEKLDIRNAMLLERMRNSGYRWVALGIESSSSEVRDGADKKYTNDDIYDVIKRIHSHGLNVIGNFIFGLKFDTNKTMQQTLDMALELNCEWLNIYSVMLYPGSKLHREATKKGIQRPEDVVGWIGYSQYAYETFPSNPDNITNTEVLKFSDDAFYKWMHHKPFLDMIKNKFGEKAHQYVLSIGASPRLKRKLLGD